jgi:hypothetical protein
MSGFQQLKEMLKRFGQSFQFSKFVQTPISKIVAINTALFVIFILLSWPGRSKEFLRLFLSNIFLSKDSI